MEVTKYEELEEAAAELKMKHMLCSSCCNTSSNNCSSSCSTNSSCCYRRFICCSSSICRCQVEVTKYEELEEAAAELKMKHLLWESLHQWDVIVADWMKVKLCLNCRGLDS